LKEHLIAARNEFKQNETNLIQKVRNFFSNKEGKTVEINTGIIIDTFYTFIKNQNIHDFVKKSFQNPVKSTTLNNFKQKLK